MIHDLTKIRNRKTGRFSTYAVDGRNGDSWKLAPGETRVLADIQGPAQITHIWMTQEKHYRECLIKITFDDAPYPQVLVPLGDFFCLGHGIVNSFQSALFTASTNTENTFNTGCALNCYAIMPFRKRAVVELVNQSKEVHNQYFYIDYESLAPGEMDAESAGYFHAEFRRTNPFSGWAPEILANEPEANVVNLGKQAWNDNYVILETKGRGHYIGCNLSVTNLQGTWWGEGDDMIWVDGYKWPPDLHGTGTEDYLNQAWGMQPTAFLHNGSSIHESKNRLPVHRPGYPAAGYQTSYVFHLQNPVRFQKEIKVTVEHGHANHLGNEMSSTAYWYAEKPTRVAAPPPVAKRLPVRGTATGDWLVDAANQCPGPKVSMNAERKKSKRDWATRMKKK